jgi:hypothetical protein
MALSAIFETCQLVLDRPPEGDPHALMYVAEVHAHGATKDVATSPVFHPELDLTAHRSALAALDAELAKEGWQREATPAKQALIGVRYHRWH